MEKTVLNPDAQRRLDDLKASFQKKCGTNPINKLMYGRILEWWNWLDWSVIFDEYPNEDTTHYWYESPLRRMLKPGTTAVKATRLRKDWHGASTAEWRYIVYRDKIGYIAFDSLSGSCGMCGALELKHFDQIITKLVDDINKCQIQEDI